MDHSLVAPVVAWFDRHARDLPWRREPVSPWAVLVSEVMLQQTPVVRVEPAWRRWMERWPTPAALADAAPDDVIREWGSLGYPRRALRLQACARVVVESHGGRVPTTEPDLRALPGVGGYTAAAVIAFALHRRAVVLDTNVRRVLARALEGAPLPPAHITVAEYRRADVVVPQDPDASRRWNAAVMELGALVCTARSPRCAACPVAHLCAWRLAGSPPPTTPRPGQPWAGTDRQARGRLMAVLRAAPGPVSEERLADAWAEADQRRRALASLVADGLAVQRDRSAATFGLPS